MIKISKMTTILGLVAAGTVAGAAMADTVMFSGALEDGDTTWLGAGNDTLTFYDVIEITVDADGEYGFYSFYPGDVGLDENMDGYIRLYESSFDPSDPDANVAEDDDYTDGDVALLDPFDDGAVGQNASGLSFSLTAGTSYFLAQTSFSDVPTSFGQPTGAYESVITGPGAITIVPAPAALAAFGLAGLAAGRRRRG